MILVSIFFLPNICFNWPSRMICPDDLSNGRGRECPQRHTDPFRPIPRRFLSFCYGEPSGCRADFNKPLCLTEINNMFTNSRMDSSSSQRRSTRKFLVYHLPVILYAAAVLAVSSLPGLQPPDVKVVALDKLAHLLEYAIFSFLTYRSFCRWELRLVSRHAFGFSALFLSLFAAFDEIFQRFIPGRSSEVWDVLADLLGALLVLVLMEMRRRRVTRGRGHCS